MKNLLLVLSLLFTANAAFAATDACEKFTTAYDRTYCSAKLFIESDKELNQVYKELKTHLKGDTSKTLTLIQRDWMEYRDNLCADGDKIKVDCNYEVNRRRTEYLRDRLRECKTGNCQIDLIRSESW